MSRASRSKFQEGLSWTNSVMRERRLERAPKELIISLVKLSNFVAEATPQQCATAARRDNVTTIRHNLITESVGKQSSGW